MKRTSNSDRDICSAQLQGSLLFFTEVFFKLINGQPYDLTSGGSCRTPMCHIVARALTQTQRHQTRRVIINTPPRLGKTELCIYYVAWSLARYPASHFLYVSYSHKLAALQTEKIRKIINLPEYRYYFGVTLDQSSRAKDFFHTNQGGSVYAAGTGGTITGFGAGLAHTDEYGGAIMMDDIHKPADVLSDVIRSADNDWYKSTLYSRTNSTQTPIIFIGQRTHEDDLCANLLDGFDGDEWDHINIPARDDAGNSIHDKKLPLEKLSAMEEKMPYVFYTQYQQVTQPAGGSVFKKEWFRLIDNLPEFKTTFITVDTAETAKTYNDATVFSLWGVAQEDGEPYLVWIHCEELWIEPKDLEQSFMDFYHSSFRFSKPSLVAIEKKSTGVTLCSVLSRHPGLILMEVERTRESGSKGHRFLNCQPYVANGQIRIQQDQVHTNAVIDHMAKITANDSHKRDDIADTMADAVKIALMDDYFNMKTPIIQNQYQYQHPIAEEVVPIQSWD